MKMMMKRTLSCFLALVMVMSYLPLNPIASYADELLPIDADHFPDDAFRNYVSDRSIDGNGDGKLSKEELEYVDTILIYNQSVSSLKGIEYFKNLKNLDCSSNNLTELDVSKNTKLVSLWCDHNHLTSLDVSKNTGLIELQCRYNNLTSLDVSNNPNLTRLNCENQQYNITVDKVTRKFEYSKFPRGFDKAKVTSLYRATPSDDALIVNGNNPSEVTYRYKVGNKEMNVTLHVTYFDSDLVRDIKVKKQPTKRVYTDGENLDLTGLVVTLKDNPGATIDVPFADFGTYKITATPKNGTSLTVANDKTKVKLTYKNLSAYTDPLTVNNTVTFKDGDKTHATVKAENGKAIDTKSMPANPTKDGYTFKEWNTRSDGKGETFTGASVVNGDMTVYAIYTQDSAPTPELKPQPKTPEPKTTDPKLQPEKHIDIIPQTGESASFAGLLVALGFSITGLAILRKKKMMKENK